jgi:hypothetical protein
VNFLSEMIRAVDGLILRIFLSDSDLSERNEEFIHETGDYDSNKSTIVRDTYGTIDVKATAVLQHVSIMIAVSGLLYSQAASKFFRFGFSGEMLLYVILALFCLRLLMVQHVSPSYSDAQNVVAKEAVLDLTAKLTFMISVALVLTVVAEVVVK